MSQEQPRRPEQEPIKYGDVFNVSGDLSSQPIAPRDAATMQSAEYRTFGQTRKDGPASLMTSAAQKNEDAGFIKHNTATNIARNEGVNVSETYDGGKRVITETLGGQAIFWTLLYTNCLFYIINIRVKYLFVGVLYN